MDVEVKVWFFRRRSSIWLIPWLSR